MTRAAAPAASQTAALAEYAHVVDSFAGEMPQVLKHNRLIEARYQLSTRASKIFALAVAKLRGRPSASLMVEFTVEEFATLCGVNKHALYAELYELTKSLMRNQPVISIPRADKPAAGEGEAAEPEAKSGRRASRAKNDAFTHVMLWPKISYKGEGSIEVHFHEDLRPYLLELTREFTRYDLMNVMRLSSNHTIRLYELLKERLFRGEWLVQYPELKELLGIRPEQYPSMGNFKQRILEPAQKEIHEVTDVYFHYKLIKSGRKYTGIRFHISSRKAPHQLAAEAAKAAAKPAPLEIQRPGDWDEIDHIDVETVPAAEGPDALSLELIARYKTGAGDLAYNGQWDAEQFVDYYRYAVLKIRPSKQEKAPAALVELALQRFLDFPALREGYLERVDVIVKRRLSLTLERLLGEETHVARLLAGDFEWLRRLEESAAPRLRPADQLDLPLAEVEAALDATAIAQLRQYLTEGVDPESDVQSPVVRRLLKRLHPAVDAIFDYWNTMCPHAPVKVRSDARKDRFALRLAQSELFRARWREAIANAGKSRFVRGENSRKQKYNIFCLLNDGFMEKLADGEYGD
jgi:plasmid replication initiation protein